MTRGLIFDGMNLSFLLLFDSISAKQVSILLHHIKCNDQVCSTKSEYL